MKKYFFLSLLIAFQDEDRKREYMIEAQSLIAVVLFGSFPPPLPSAETASEAHTPSPLAALLLFV